MSTIVNNCPRCNTQHTTFDVAGANVPKFHESKINLIELFVVCRNCQYSITFLAEQGSTLQPSAVSQKSFINNSDSIDHILEVKEFLSVRNNNQNPPPEHIPTKIRDAFEEGTSCLSIGCVNAASSMFRLCVALATEELLPDDPKEGPNSHTRRTLALRLIWLFDNNILPQALKDLSDCIRDDGNEGTHEGTLTESDAADLLDFTTLLLERLYTEPEKLRLAKEKRAARKT